MATTIPGKPVNTPYVEELDYTDLDNAQTITNNFTATTLQGDQEVDGPDNYLICDRTGFKIPIAEGLREEWDGGMVRAKSWERRHPQDFIRSRGETRRDGSPRPEQDDVFVTDTVDAADL